MPISDEIRDALEHAFNPQHIEIIDESEAHRGHAGYIEGGGSHFRVRMRADAFKGQSRLARHRAVHAALGSGLIGRIHALALELEA
ncbi:MAG: BolA family transcriptional regulator [Sediminimonas qiaohouensis]|uniref:BolA family transcriptional regulator n=1 Tax=Sediminimonas qiaohouensis TaxID=552061 RepID=A0A7C9HJW0_9RHOB|nr:BolA family protein [Sediminimonas qiaohouensis]MTJ03348.1 BolA family transcriptional regulator [Sediminimonas qiaohouensis]